MYCITDSRVQRAKLIDHGITQILLPTSPSESLMWLWVFDAQKGMCCAGELDNGAALIHVAPLALCACRFFPPLFPIPSASCVGSCSMWR